MFRGMNNFILVLAALLAVAGCAAPDQSGFEPPLVSPVDSSESRHGLVFPSTLQVSAEFSAEEQEAIVSAVDRWKARTNGRANLSVTVGDDPTAPCRIHLGVYEPLPEGIVQGEAVDAGRSFECEVKLARDGLKSSSAKHKTPYAKAVEQVTVHELGHVFGLEHLDDGIMFWAFDPKNFLLDDMAAEAFCSARGCPDGMGEAL